MNWVKVKSNFHFYLEKVLATVVACANAQYQQYGAPAQAAPPVGILQPQQQQQGSGGSQQNTPQVFRHVIN